MKRILLLIALLAGTFIVSYAQKATKISPSTRLIIADREGKLSLDAAKKEMSFLKKNKRNAPWKILNPNETTFEDEDDSDGFPFATPTYVNGTKVVQCWIGMTDDNYNALEALGVKIQTKFDGKVVANVPVDALEKVAELENVTKVSVAQKLKKNTYRSRILTNVDDVLTYSTDAQTAGLLQAYDGTGVVLGVIDVGIDFGHEMFLNRIKKKYVYNTTAGEVQEYTESTVYYTDYPHGTLTSSIAGGSDFTATAYVFTTSSSYTTVNNAKFGGMAPGTDLVLCDLGDETTEANIATCIKNISDYADEVGKPCVISLSLGSHFGPHDGTGYLAEVCAQYTGAGKIILYASGNEGEDGIYLGKNASASSPAMTVLTSDTRSSYSVDYGAMISYARTPNVELAVRYYVVNTSSNTILWTSNEITTDDYFVDDEGNIELYGAEISINDTGSDGTTPLSTYFTAYNNDSNNYGYLCGYMEKDSHNDKWYVETILYYLKAVSNNYKIGVSIYPKNGTCYVDSWSVGYIDFTASSATVNGNSFTAGSNESSASDEASYPSVISVGSYVSSKYWRAGTNSASSQAWTNNGTYQQISMFSSYQEEGSGPTGLKQPWITAPGEVIIAAYNSGYSASSYYYAYGTSKVLGAMSGTSMATPCAAGITALWLQAKPNMTPDEVKEVMAETAIKDSYVTGTYASHFGQGKIDALAGINYIMDNYVKAKIGVHPTNVDFMAKLNETATKSINVKGKNLTGNITATLNDANGVFSIDRNSIADSDATNGMEINIDYHPISVGPHIATITLTSAGAEDVIVTLNGTVEEVTNIADADLAALRKFYTDFHGTEWNGTLWDTTINNVSVSWSGVDFDSEGHVTSIELPDRNVSGTLSTATALALSHLTSLDLSGNQLVGDVSTLANVERLPLLTTLDLSYNQIDELSAMLPTTITTLNLSNQHRARNNKKVYPGIDNLTAIGLDVSDEMTVALPSLWGYNHSRQSFDAHSQLTVYDDNLNSKATLKWSSALGAYTFTPSSWQLKEAQDAAVIIIPTTSSGENYTNGYNSAYRAQLHFTEGDANLNGWTDVNDVQRTLNFVLNSNNSTTFGLWSANTYDDDTYDANNETINIQDIVCTINIVLDNEGNGRMAQRRANRVDVPTANHLYADGHTMVLDANDEVAAFSLHLRGAKASQVKLLLNSRQWQMQTRNTADGVSLLVFSPTGNTLPSGITSLLRTTVEAEPVSIQATDTFAEELPISIRGGSVSGIESIAPSTESTGQSVYDLQGRRMGNGSLKKGIYIINGQKIIK